MLVTLSGMMMLVRLLQLWNAPSPMLVTLLGMVTLVRQLQDRNAISPDAGELHWSCRTVIWIALATQYSSGCCSQRMRLPMLVTLLAMVTLVRPAAVRNA